ncbi:MAG: hypothetical protein A2365_01195 [Candidatus Nealsonbacteria bacterium RIFOXYB1_FULL_40_15]|uniref:Methyltransferase domain-containing protein n=2 Tax=Candidatus Nealsoniibacteriota TaxID=1817911 RepID=A0A1G2EMQ7_9BACT|nr:MAG: hypothetical protein A2427_04725 [Candidatus Nealsonbacteria bacterium RIFOXYC1_FULL_40_7]OGZ26886.1 MAG: hypothetical protein A2365_01195 [Candidatus Nealsonbacteria bacterium RIFOXYB1_FULL_40_15]OGZ29311.1 MAG: hypothetical protein A2562_01650 [Candidatus Nealsonbacteria bacterium RIFOXYD1_FULL_39_11]
MIFLNPKEILDQLDLKDDMSAAEFGAGSGSFSIPLAKKLDEGLVYAIDVQTEPLSALKGRAKQEGIKNIRVLRSNLEKQKGSSLQSESVDLVVIPNMLFQAEDKGAIISEGSRILKSGGILVIIDWRKGSSKGPEERFSREEAVKASESKGFRIEKEIDAGKYHYCLVFRK